MKDKRQFRPNRGLRWWCALFAAALILIPNWPLALNNKGWAYYQQGMLDKAEPLFLETLKINPRYAKARLLAVPAGPKKRALATALEGRKWGAWLTGHAGHSVRAKRYLHPPLHEVAADIESLRDPATLNGAGR